MKFDEQRALAARLSVWLPIEDAPRDGTHIVALTESGALVRALWVDDEDGGSWQAWGEHPPCWTDGICWEVNENEERSDQPVLWTNLPTLTQENTP